MPELSTDQMRSFLAKIQEWAAGPADVVISLLKNMELTEDKQAFSARHRKCLDLWELLGVLLNADPQLQLQRERRAAKKNPASDPKNKNSTEDGEDYADEWYRLHASKDINDESHNLDSKSSSAKNDIDAAE
ncbi:hypothetical protein K435DRAFT_801572 [Dendrothele bispora CBS 962.96]|uniref:Uncharacterized protein n=1 Tax=Dendrothele bispora (strain CBS 962.96) TaxID=1314807 RepID=A0A4S8LPF4_DENBC|nr:hypothetical protein K435DRAFT_801572 [Dendrothele bispora CBS 962.96]